ncbi:MAG: class I SAM-dependent methyltransferase, partial [Robiginitalea sp.]|nr:class I SAM-dependent methyltransferase [Robiginitalea sp.]
IAAHNFERLGVRNIQVHPGDGMDRLQALTSGETDIDWIYLDPSRRGRGGRRVFRLSDCEPPVVELLPQLFSASRYVLLKTAPMLDLTEGIKQLGNVREVHVVGVHNEVKELLWWLEREWTEPPELIAVDLNYPDQPMRFTASEESTTEVSFEMPLKYLYEPNACMLKAGAFKTAARAYELYKLHPSTHLYTSQALVPFPGRRFEIKALMPYKPGKLPYRKANVSSRNFPESVAAIRKRNRIADGGSLYLFLVRCMDDSLCVLETERI